MNEKFYDDDIKKTSLVREKFLNFGSPVIEQAEIDEVVDCLKSGWLTTGPRVHQFENDFRNYIGSKFCSANNKAKSLTKTPALIDSFLLLGKELVIMQIFFFITVFYFL